MEPANLKIIPNIRCKVFVDSEMITIAPENVITKISLRAGEYYIQLISVDNPNWKVEEIIKIEKDKVWKVQITKVGNDVMSDLNNIRVAPSTNSVIPIVLDYDDIGAMGDAYIVQKEYKFGVVNNLGQKVLPCEYDDIRKCDGDFVEGLARIERNGRWGYMAPRYGSCPAEIIPCIYDYATDFCCGVARVIKDGEYGFIDKNGCETIPCNSVSDFIAKFPNIPLDAFLNKQCSDCNNIRVACKRDRGRFIEGQLIDINGTILTRKYKYIGYFCEGLACVRGENDNYGYIDKTGKEVIPCLFNSADDFQEGLAGVVMDGKYGYIDKNGSVVIPFIYDPDPFCGYSSYPGFIGGHTIAVKNNKWGIIDKTGKEVIPCLYNDAHIDRYGIKVLDKSGWKEYDHNLVERPSFDEYEFSYLKPVRLTNGKQGFAKGNSVIQGHYYDETYDFYYGLAKVVNQGIIRFIDENFKTIIWCSNYDEAGSFSNGCTAWVKKNGKYGFINKKGDEVIPCIYDRLWYYDSDELTIVEKNQKKGIIDKYCKEIVPCIYESISRFNSLYSSIDDTWRYFNARFSLVKMDGKYGVLSDNKEIVSCKYEEINRFIGDFAIVSKENKYGAINKKGKEVIHCMYDSISLTECGLHEVKKDGLYGVVNSSGTEIIPCIYSRLDVINSKRIKAWKNQYQMILDTSNKVLVCNKNQM